MHATIRSFNASALADQAVDDAVRRLAATLGTLPGFVAFVVLDAGAGCRTAVCLFESAVALQDADRSVARWLAAQPEASRWGAAGAGATTGEVLYQRGL